MRGRAAAMTLPRPSAVVEAPGPGAKRDRQRAIRELIAGEPIASQGDLVDRLIARGFGVTQATVSRDIAELGLFMAPRNGRHVYVIPDTFAAGTGSTGSPAVPASDERLRRILADIPVTIGRSGLILLVTGTPGTASVIAPGDRRVVAHRAGGDAGRRQHAPRPLRRRGPPRRLAGPLPTHPR